MPQRLQKQNLRKTKATVLIGLVSAKRFLTCCADRIQKTVVVIRTDQSAWKHNSVERDVILCHELMKRDLHTEDIEREKRSALHP